MTTIESFKGLPVTFETYLIERYHSFMTTCRYLELFNTSYDFHYMLLYENQDLIELLIFGNSGNTCTCFNSLVSIDQNIIQACTKKIFEDYPFIQKQLILASYTNYDLKKSFLYDKSNDYILKLPSTVDNYYLELGQSTRRHIKNFKKRFLRDYPEAQFITKYNNEIERVIVDKIFLLSSNRMKVKGIYYGKDRKQENNIYEYSRHYGCVAYIELNGEVVAGCISYILNKRIYLHVISHDNNYSKYNIGEMCVIYLIQTSIEKGFSTFHFLWGENDLKNRLLAKPHALSSYCIYRTITLENIMNANKAKISQILIRVRQSRLAQPLRNVIKNYRKKKLINDIRQKPNDK